MEQFTDRDITLMKLLHYFITEKNYSPVVLHGAKDEIWLENMTGEYKIVRLVSNYIHNNEQLSFDIFKTKRIVKNIKKKTFNFSMPVLSIFLNLGENVSFHDEDNIDFVNLERITDIGKYDFLYSHFPDLDEKLTFSEEGMNLFLKITDDINKKNVEEAVRIDKIFKPKKPIVTVSLIVINVLIYVLGVILYKYDILSMFSNYRPAVMDGEYYRLVTSMFLHGGILHLFINMEALYVLGKQAEGFFGKTKFLLIYLLSGLCGNLLSILLNQSTMSVGASGAIFGILGALLYFGYNFRVYLGSSFVREIVPVILINLFIGFMIPGIDNFAHIGGLVAGLTTSMAFGFTTRSSSSDKINGIILTIMLFAFMIIMNFFYTGI